MTEDTIDWDSFWSGEVDGGPMDADASADKIAYLERFITKVGEPESFAAVGCGDGAVPKTIANNYPQTSVRGYDIAESVVHQNQKRYSEGDNISFAVAELPDPEIDNQFELVYCYATLQYVRDIEQAIRNLYAMVKPGGHLILNYPNEEFCETYAENIEESTSMYRRFKLVCNGVNEISQDRISEILGVPTRDYWKAVNAPEKVHGNLSWYPCVYVRKPSQ